MLDPKKIKKNFPLLNKNNIVFLDNASSTQKPQSVIDELKNYYENYNANVHRGIYTISEKSTEAFEACRKEIANFINAEKENEIIFTRNTTESINLISYCWGEKNIQKNDEIIVSALEHHSNLIPWQQLCHRKKAKLKRIEMDEDMAIQLKDFEKLITTKTKLLCITGMSNITGTIPPIKDLIKIAKKHDIKVLVDAAQSAAHMSTDVRDLGCDFLVFSAHKMLGPTGVGILYGKEGILKNMPPFLFGGSMIKEVDDEYATFGDIPWRFEAGTPNIADVIAFREAIKFLERVGLKNIFEHEKKLLKYAKERFSKYPGITLYSPSDEQIAGGVMSFSIKDVHPHDIATIFNEENVCIRAGHHCSQPMMRRLGIPATARMSFYLYNTTTDIDRAEKALQNVFKIFNVKN